MYTDSAGNADLGCGAVFGHHWAYLGWSDHWKASDIFSVITFLELVPITMAFAIWGSNLSGKQLIIHTDNEALVSILNCNTSKSKRVMYLLRQLVLQGLMLNIQFKAKGYTMLKQILFSDSNGIDSRPVFQEQTASHQQFLHHYCT